MNEEEMKCRVKKKLEEEGITEEVIDQLMEEFFKHFPKAKEGVKTKR